MLGAFLFEELFSEKSSPNLDQRYLVFTPLEFLEKIAPENGWLEDDHPFLLKPGLFSGALAVGFREGKQRWKRFIITSFRRDLNMIWYIVNVPMQKLV